VAVLYGVDVLRAEEESIWKRGYDEMSVLFWCLHRERGSCAAQLWAHCALRAAHPRKMWRDRLFDLGVLDALADAFGGSV
jgi:hypothetical protein